MKLLLILFPIALGIAATGILLTGVILSLISNNISLASDYAVLSMITMGITASWVLITKNW